MVKLQAAWPHDGNSNDEGFDFADFNDHGSFLHPQRVVFKITRRRKTQKRKMKRVPKVDAIGLKQCQFALDELRGVVVRESILRTLAFCKGNYDLYDPRHDQHVYECFHWADLPYWVRHLHEVANAVSMTTCEIRQLFKTRAVTEPADIARLGDCLRARALNGLLEADVGDIGLTTEDCHRQGVFVTPFKPCDCAICEQCARRVRLHKTSW